MFAYLNHHKQLKFYKNFEFEAEGAEGEALGKFTVPPPPDPQIPTTAHPKPPEIMGTINTNDIPMRFALRCEL